MHDRKTAPFEDYLHELLESLKPLDAGEVASYIPELAKASPDGCAISFATIDGEVYSVGDSETLFSIQSVSKPFAYAGALMRLGQEALLKKVGVEPTGDAFNSIVLDEVNNRPFNPMVNAGAIAVSALSEGDSQSERWAHVVDLFSRFAGRRLTHDNSVFLSESATGHRNRAIAYLMLNTGMIDRDPEEVLDLYFKQCALLVSTPDLALMGATLANNGVHPRTGEVLLGPAEVRDVLTLMMSCGMYDYAGEWSYEVGLPAKSGVSGGVLAILPGQLSIAVWSPPLDEIGNSVRGIAACRRISGDFGLHQFMNAATVETVVRRETRASAQPSMRIRNPRERDLLATHGGQIGLVELQGALYLASAERMIRQLQDLTSSVSHLVFDMRRLRSVDAAAQRFFESFLRGLADRNVEVAFAEVHSAGGAAAPVLTKIAEACAIRVFTNVDGAVEVYEERLLETVREPFDATRYGLGNLELFKGLNRAQLRMVEAMIQPMQFEANDYVLRRGRPGTMAFVIARGSVSVMVPNASGDNIRVACIGPGQFFGEMAVLEGGLRSTDIVADEKVVCYGLSAEHLKELSVSDPEAHSVILTNMVLEFSNRLRRSNDIIGSLQ